MWQVLSAVVLVLGLTALLRFTPLGRAVRATRGNPEMARIIGIDPNHIYLVVLRPRHAAAAAWPPSGSA